LDKRAILFGDRDRPAIAIGRLPNSARNRSAVLSSRLTSPQLEQLTRQMAVVSRGEGSHMTEMSAYQVDTVENRGSGVEHQSGVVTALSLLLIVGLPTAFWMAVLELANYALWMGLSNTVRLAVAAALIGLLTLIWGFIMTSARQRDAFEREERLQQNRR